MSDDDARFALRIALLILLPFFLGAFVLPHTQMMDGQMLGSPGEAKSGDEIAYSFSHPGNDLSVPQSVGAIFPLANYLDFPPLVSHGEPEICFQDNDSYLVLADGSKFDPEFQWIVDFNNKTQLIVMPDGVNCTKASASGQNDYRWFVNMAIPSDDPRFKGNITFVPQTMAFPRMIMDYGLLQGLAMIPVAYLFIWYPAAGIWKKLHKGMAEQ
jgi:hypothetical protein